MVKISLSLTLHIDKTIDYFVDPEGMNLLKRLGIDTGFLLIDPLKWDENHKFINAKKIVGTLVCVNDTAERAVKLMEEYNGLLTESEEQKQFILQCVMEHRKLFPDCSKRTLKRKYPE